MYIFSQLENLKKVSSNIENQICIFGDEDGGLNQSLLAINNIVRNIETEMQDIEKQYNPDLELIEPFLA